MKIEKIELINHPFFGNIVFNFCNSSGDPFDNIVFAGENGCGKTQLLNIIYEFSSFSTSGVVNNERRIFSCLLSPDEVAKTVEKDLLSNPTGKIIIVYDYSFNNDWNRIKATYESIGESGSIVIKTANSSSLFRDQSVKGVFCSIFSTAEINYNPSPVETITSKEVDANITSSKKSGINLATDIQQLLIDCQSNDANELQVWVNSNIGVAPPASVRNRRISRFKAAFSTVFTNMNYDRIETEEGKKKVIFKKNNTDIAITNLSSGEKQIVFRGAFLLQDQQSLKGCSALIDEPEISLHPKWQEKIFEFYKKLFTDNNGAQTSQLFFATHSQFVLRSALDSQNSTQIFLLDASSGVPAVHPVGAPFILPTTTSAELNYFAFNIPSNDYHIELYGYLQSKVALSLGKQSCSLPECDTYICQQPQYYTPALHEKHFTCVDSGRTFTDNTLPTYIRNAIDHPTSGRIFTEAELRTSIELLIKLCK